jgi:hypothetical protein
MLATDRRQADAHVVANAVIVTENLFDNIHADPRCPAFLRKDRLQGDAAADGRRGGDRSKSLNVADREPRAE